jgi:hypothetical protein
LNFFFMAKLFTQIIIAMFITGPQRAGKVGFQALALVECAGRALVVVAGTVGIPQQAEMSGDNFRSVASGPWRSLKALGLNHCRVQLQMLGGGRAGVQSWVLQEGASI